MNTLKQLSTLALASLFIFSCSSDDDSIPEIVNEEELITTTTISLTSEGNPTVTFTATDLDGDGPNAPVIDDVNLLANTTYTGTVTLLNETESPAEDITEEVAEEADEHQFFYQASTSLNVTTDYADADADGNPVGINFSLITGEASNGTFTVTLRHEPSKGASGVAEGDITNAGGETDVTQTFNVIVE